jgi:hypothetical protein
VTANGKDDVFGTIGKEICALRDFRIESDPTGDVIDHSGRHCISAVILMNEPHFDPSQFLDILSRNSGEVER